MSFFDLTRPDGEALSGTTIITVAGLMFMYTFFDIWAGFGGGLTTMPLVSMLIPVKMAAPISVMVGTATASYANGLRYFLDYVFFLQLIHSTFACV